MLSYKEYYSQFDVSKYAAFLEGDLEKGINPAIECCDRFSDTNKIAILWEGANGDKKEISFKELKEKSSQVANFLKQQNLRKGDFISGLLPRTPELIYVILGAWKLGVIYQPLFTAFGPRAIEQRLKKSLSKIVFTDEVNREKLNELDLDDYPKVCVLKHTENYIIAPGDLDLHSIFTEYSPHFTPIMLTGEDNFLMLSTSGTTGYPQAVAVPVKALLSFKLYMDLAVDLRASDRFWNIADPGWAYGLYYNVVGALLCGHSLTFYEGGFTPESTRRIIKEYKITNLAGSPTAFRLLMGAGDEFTNDLKGQLRAVSSAGEPLNPEVIKWFREKLDVVICDHYGQTETGMTVNNYHALKHEIVPGSMGYPLPGYRICIISEDNEELPPNTSGLLAIDMKNSPLLWFFGYYHSETPAIKDGYYRTGDSAERTSDGRFTYVGRNDDVITSAGYRIGPFDVESALVEHPAVLESAVIGKPDPERTEIVKAFVVLNKKYQASKELEEELSLFVKKKLAAHAYPREIEFIDELPKTPSGKIQRYLLRNKDRK